MTFFRTLFLLSAVLGLSGLAACASTGGKPAGAGGQEKVVYHVNDSANASDAMRNIKNHLGANPGTQIVVVTHSKGVDFLFEGAADKNGNPYNINVEDLQAKGVQFDVCAITLQSRKLDRSKLLPGMVIVPSGVAEIAKLQAREGYVYIKP